MRNHTAVTTFILLGLTNDPQLQILLFVFLFLTYMFSVTGNLTIITLTLLDSHLQTPMYFFLRNFSFLEVSFCDAGPLLKISCSDTWVIEQMVILVAVFALIITLVCVFLSYTYIIQTILRFPSVQQRKKAFSTCSSHMIVVSITYGSCIFIYIKPSAKDEVAINKGVSVLTTSVAPLLNPFIYTLRNKQVKQAFNDFVKRIIFLSTK
ncbi:PREDICTED: LOW QUALITY PROTEIN: olfactory receptor 6C2-like [Myotis davidii]|uniref:LOW QUALITY PROTEIN: olfactory receptor 6C2-like n=1 Tax=Myotis davidii TaxID=225400 RepID=UPI0007671088|nr:PREDICTED: LOW QUALITY PROTEIN: olfactory receptor 6C2-like [Myotis davidii]